MFGKVNMCHGEGRVLPFYHQTLTWYFLSALSPPPLHHCHAQAVALARPLSTSTVLHRGNEPSFTSIYHLLLSKVQPRVGNAQHRAFQRELSPRSVAESGRSTRAGARESHNEEIQQPGDMVSVRSFTHLSHENESFIDFWGITALWIPCGYISSKLTIVYSVHVT